MSDKSPHILNASSNLLGISLVLVTALKLTKAGLATLADEVSLLSGIVLMASCILSYLAMRGITQARLYERWADYLFLLGSITLFGAVLLFATGLS